MLIALLALLGVNLLALVVLLAFVVTRKRWVTRQQGAFRGVARSVSGEAHGLHSKWRRGYGRWVRDVLVWTRGPFYFWNELLPVDGRDEERAAEPGEVKRLGDQAQVVRLASGAAAVEVAARAEDRDLLVGPFNGSVDTVAVPSSGPLG